MIRKFLHLSNVILICYLKLDLVPVGCAHVGWIQAGWQLTDGTLPVPSPRLVIEKKLISVYGLYCHTLFSLLGNSDPEIGRS